MFTFKLSVQLEKVYSLSMSISHGNRNAQLINKSNYFKKQQSGLQILEPVLMVTLSGHMLYKNVCKQFYLNFLCYLQDLNLTFVPPRPVPVLKCLTLFQKILPIMYLPYTKIERISLYMYKMLVKPYSIYFCLLKNRKTGLGL